MDQVFSRFVDDAASIAESGRWDAFNKRLKEMAANPGGPDNVWLVELFMRLSFQIFSEYLKLKTAYKDADPLDISVIAWRARNLLELSIWAMYCTESKENARRLYEDAGRDLTGVLTAFQKWGEATAQNPDWFQSGTRAQEDLSNRAAARGIESISGSFKEVRAAAQDVKFGHHFNLCFKLLSKFAHPTAMQIVLPANDEVATIHRDFFFGEGCLFFTGAFTTLEKALSTPLSR
jgi:hypothetical protein